MRCFLALFALLLPVPAFAQDVQISGDVTPSPATSPIWTIPGGLVVGVTGTGNLTISGNGTVSSTVGGIGNGIAAIGTVNISGGSWTNSGILVVGGSGNGTLGMTGGSVLNTGSVIGSSVGSNGLVSITGGTWTNNGNLNVGGSGNGTLQISGSGSVEALNTRVAFDASSTGSLKLLGGTLTTGQVSEGSGSGTVIFNGGTLRLSGDQADLFSGFSNGSVTFEAGGGTIDTQGFNIATSLNLTGTGGLNKQGSGTLTLTGANNQSGGTVVRNGTLVIAGGTLSHPGAGIYVAPTQGDNATLINNGGTISTSLINLGDNSGTVAALEIHGGTVTNSWESWIGNSGNGSLTLTDGILSNTIGNIARSTGSTGLVTMSGGTWNNTQLFVVGNRGVGTLNLSGGTINTVTGEIGRNVQGSGIANVTGGVWNNTGTLSVGTLGSGVLNLHGGVVSAAQVVRGSGPGTINFNGGTLRLNASQENLFEGFQVGDITLTGSGGTIDTQGFNVATSFAISGGGPLAKAGNGTLTLTGSQAYTGATNVQAGRLVVDGTLASSGVTVANGATLVPGTDVSTLALNGLTLNDLSYLDFQLGTPGVIGSGINDLIEIAGDLVLGGLLNIETLTGFGVGNYRLMNYTGSLTDNLLLFNNVPGGFEYAVNTATANQVNLTVSAATAQYWDGPNTTPQGVPFGSGGSGTWSVRSTNWTNAGGNANSNSLGTLTSVFGGTSGTVTIADGSTVRASALAFEADGYEITAAGNGTLQLVGSGLVDTQANSVTISAPITSNSTLIKQGTGLLTLTADNTVTGGVSVRNGSTVLTSTGAIRTYPLTVGQSSGDIATLDNAGGYISSSGVTLGSAAGASGNMTMSAGSVLVNGEIRVGDSGAGALTLSGGTIQINTTSSYSFMVGRNAGSTGSVTMTGGTLSTNYVHIGLAGEGSFNMSGGTVNAGLNSFVATDVGSVGHLQLSGNAIWNQNFFLSVGARSTGTLEISDNAELNIRFRGLEVGGGVLGTSAGNGTVLMTGGSITSLFGLRIGDKGTGVFTLSNGTIVGSGSSLLGANGGTGTMTMTGGTWTTGNSAAGIVMGASLTNASGTLNLSGGTIHNTIASVGSGGGTGIANVSGGSWNNSGEFRVGDGPGGNGTLNLTGGTITSALGNIGREGGSTGVVNASGGVWNNVAELIVGNVGNGNVTISGTAEVSSSETIVGRQASGVGSLTLTGGRLTTGALREELGNGTVTFDGGTLRLSGNQANLFGGFETGDVMIESGGATIDTQNFVVASSTDIGGTGGLTKLGAGSLTLGGTNTYIGATDITVGSFVVNGSLATTSLTMGNDTTLSGGGDVAGDVILGDNVIINPGDGIGTLTLGSLGLNASTILNFDLGSPALSDRIVVNGDLTLAGTLNIANLTGFGIGTYRLFDYTGSLTDNGLLFGITPGAFDLTLSTSTTNEVNLLVTASAAQYWDGPNTTPQGIPDGTGGTGVWDAATTNWTNVSGNANAAWDDTVRAVFAGTGGTVTIADGFTASAPSLTFQTDGYILNADGTGALQLSGSGLVTVQTGTAILFAPFTGTAPLVKEGTGTLNLYGTNNYTGETSVRDGALEVRGSGSISHASSDLAVGRYFGDDASLLIRDTASVTNRIGFLGADAGSTGTATILSGTWTNTDELRIGDAGTGHLTIEDGTITSTIGNIARGVGSTGTVIMNGGTWENSVLFVVGNQGVGTLTLNGGTIQSVTSTIGLNAGGTGTAVMTDGLWTNSSELRVGDYGNGTLTIEDGTISSTIGNIARNGGSTGTVIMNGGTWSDNNLFVVGNTGVGMFTQTGGSLSTLDGEIGRTLGGIGTATLSGGVWSNSNSLTIGKFGIGTLNLLAGGTIDAAGRTITIAAHAGSEGTLNIGSPDLDNPTAAGTLLADDIAFGNGQGTIRFNQTDAFTISIPITGAGSLVQRGTGSTTLAVGNSYTGSTNLENGSLFVGADNALGTGLLVISGGTTLGVAAGGDYRLPNDVEVLGDFQLDIADTASLEFDGALSLGEETRTLTLLDSGALCFAGAIAGDGGLTLMTSAVGPTVLFCGPDDNTFAGTLTIGSGVQIGLQKDPGQIAVSGDFDLQAGAYAVMLGGMDQFSSDSNVTINGTMGFLNIFASNIATFASLHGGATGVIENFSAPVVLALGGGDFAGMIDDTNGGTIELRKFGTDTLTLSGANTFSGGVTITSGNLVAANTSALGSGPVTLEGGALSLSNTVTTGSLDWSGGEIRMTLGVTPSDLQLSGDLTLSGAGGHFNFTAGSGFALSTWYSVMEVGGVVGADANDFHANSLGGGVPRFAFNDSILQVFFLPTVQVFYGANNKNLTLSTPVTDGPDDIVQLVKQGVKNLTLTAANTYSGNTIIESGTLTLGTRKKSSGSILGDVENNTVFAFKLKDAYTFSGAITGTGQVQQLGKGQLTLAGNNAHTGGTLLRAGTVNIAHTSAFGSGPLTIAGKVKLNNTTGAPLTLFGNISQFWNSNFTFLGDNDLNLGNGGVLLKGTRTVGVTAGLLTVGGVIAGDKPKTGLGKSGAGTLLLLADNTFTGRTTIKSGTLVLGNGGTSGSIASSKVTNNGVLAFNRSDDIVFAANISGRGLVEQNGDGILTLTGKNAYRGGTYLNSGILLVGSPSALGKGALILNDGLLGAVSGQSEINVAGALFWNSDARIALNLDIDNTLSQLVTVRSGIQRLGTDKLTFEFSTGTILPDSIFLVMTVRGGFGDLTADDFDFVTNDPGLTGTFRIDGDNLFFDDDYIPGGYVMSAVPEPSTAILLLAAGLGIALLRRKKAV